MITYKYKAYTNLLLELGKLDYIFELTQISLLEFQKNLDTSPSPTEYLKQKSIESGIIVNYDGNNNLYNLVTLSQIANIYHYVETYFYELKDEYNSYTENDSDKLAFSKGETKLQSILNLLNRLNRTNLQDKIPNYLIDIFEYYHILRVCFSHKSTTELKDITAKRNKALKHFENNSDLILKYRTESFLNNKDELTYQDFFLFTQVSKELALILSSFLFPNPSGFINKESLNRKKKGNDSIKNKRIVKNYLITNYGYICDSEVDEDLFLNKIVQIL